MRAAGVRTPAASASTGTGSYCQPVAMTSAGASRTFCAVDCQTLMPMLAEAPFGARKGAATSASERKRQLATLKGAACCSPYCAMAKTPGVPFERKVQLAAVWRAAPTVAEPRMPSQRTGETPVAPERLIAALRSKTQLAKDAWEEAAPEPAMPRAKEPPEVAAV